MTTSKKSQATKLALALFGSVSFSSVLIAEQPSRPLGDQPAINQAAPEAKKDDVETPFYGIGLENTDRSIPRVTYVKPGSNIDKAGLEVGDLILEFGDVRDLPFEQFLEGVEKVIDDTDKTDSIHIAYERAGRVAETEMKGFGRSFESLRRLKQRSESRVEEALSPDQQKDQPQAWSSEEPVSTEMIEEYLALQQQAEQGTLRGADRARYDRLGGVVLGGYGGVALGTQQAPTTGGAVASGAGQVGIGQAGTGQVGAAGGATANAATQGGAITNNPNVPQGANVDRFANSALRQEIQTLRATQQQGQLSTAQNRRLTALNQLSRATGRQGRAGGLRGANQQPNVSANPLLNGGGQLNRQKFQQLPAAQQAELQRLERGSRFGALNPQQQQQLQRFRQQRRGAAAGQAGANNNMPRGAAVGANAQGQQNASPVQQGVGAAVGGSAAGSGQVPTTSIGK